MTSGDSGEYRALRDTIRERGTARVWLFAAGFFVWATLTLAAAALALPPIMTLLPLAVLAATFEAVAALHVGVERIGRYLLVFHADEWERAAARFGRPAGALAMDPLFTAPFLAAAVLNALPTLVSGPMIPQEIAAVLLPPAAFVVRVLVVQARARQQRAVDATRFEQIRSDDEPTHS